MMILITLINVGNSEISMIFLNVEIRPILDLTN